MLQVRQTKLLTGPGNDGRTINDIAAAAPRNAPDAHNEVLARSFDGERYAGTGKRYLSEPAQEAIQENRLVERDILGIRRVGYNQINPDGSEGGFVELSTVVSKNAHINKDAAVLNNSRVSSGSKVHGNAKIISGWICNNAEVPSGVIVSGYEVVSKTIIIPGNKDSGNSEVL